MKLSAPLHRLKSQARALARQQRIPLHQALDQIAEREGFSTWSLLASRGTSASPARDILTRLQPGDLILVGARPGNGKTALSLELVVEAMKTGAHGAFFSLEYTQSDVDDLFQALGEDQTEYAERFVLDSSDSINAKHIMARLAHSPRGTMVVVDYLQVLDQKRDNPPLMEQVRALRGFARDGGLVLIFISQIDRAYDSTTKAFPGLEDVRLPNPLNLKLFDKVCFLSNGEPRFSAVA